MKEKNAGSIAEVVEFIKELSADTSIPKNVRSTLKEVEQTMLDTDKEVGVRVNSALQAIEDVSLDPNLSSFARTQILDLSSVLEGIIE